MNKAKNNHVIAVAGENKKQVVEILRGNAMGMDYLIEGTLQEYYNPCSKEHYEKFKQGQL